MFHRVSSGGDRGVAGAVAVLSGPILAEGRGRSRGAAAGGRRQLGVLGLYSRRMVNRRWRRASGSIAAQGAGQGEHAHPRGRGI